MSHNNYQKSPTSHNIQTGFQNVPPDSRASIYFSPGPLLSLVQEQSANPTPQPTGEIIIVFFSNFQDANSTRKLIKICFKKN